MNEKHNEIEEIDKPIFVEGGHRQWSGVFHAVRVKIFVDGRVVLIKSNKARSGLVYSIRVLAGKNFHWDDGVGYPDLAECEQVAFQLFGFDEWTAKNV